MCSPSTAMYHAEQFIIFIKIICTLLTTVPCLPLGSTRSGVITKRKATLVYLDIA